MTASAQSPTRVTAAEGIATSSAAGATSRAAVGGAGLPRSGVSAPSGDGPAARSVARLGLMIGHQRLLVELADAGEIVALPPVIVPVPLTRDWFLGVTNVRGSLFTVIDLRRFAGDGVTEIGKETRLLSLAPSLGFNVTILVNRMLGLRNTASMSATVNSSPGSAAAGWLGRSYADAEGHIWRELSLSRLVATPEFLMVGR